MFDYNNKLYTGYIYLIKNNVNQKCYIGQTVRDIKTRWIQHKSDAKHKRTNSYALYNAINKYGDESFSIKELLSFSASSLKQLIVLLNEAEKECIAKYNTLIPNGYNVTPGGDNQSVRILRPVDAYDANGNLLKSYDSIAEASFDLTGLRSGSRISDCCNGKALSCCGYIWRYHGEPFNKYEPKITQVQLDRFSNFISVDKYSMDGIYLKSYDTLTSAILDTDSKSNTARSVIKGCCDGIYNQAYGFVWRYKGDPFDKYEFSINKKYRQVNVYTLDNLFLDTFVSISQALKTVINDGKKRGSAHVSDCCNHKRKSAYGYKWFYSDDPSQPDKTKILVA